MAFTIGKVWIGASWMTISNEWIWVTTETNLENGYTNWGIGEPSGDGSCAVMNRYGEWNDISCDRIIGYACEIP